MMPMILEGGEPFFYPGNEIGCLVFHGFTSSPQEVDKLGSHLAMEGYSVLGVRTFGHATTREDLARSRRSDWLASAEDGYHLLSGVCDTIIPIGLSVGGTLAMMIALRFPVAGFVAMATPIRIPPNPIFTRLKPILKPLSFVYPFQSKGSSIWYDPSAQAERVAYDYRPLRSILELEVFLAEVKTYLPQIQAPGLLIHSLTDDFIPHNNMIEIYDLLGSPDKEMISIEISNHIITCDISCNEVFSIVTEFVKRKSG